MQKMFTLSRRSAAVVGALAAAVIVGSYVSVPVEGQAPAAAPAAGEKPAPKQPTPKTPWGDPDLQGIWDFGTITPLQRPDNVEQKALTPEEVARLNEEAATRGDTRIKEDVVKDVEAAYNAAWWDRGVSAGRTSLITDPPDGKLPPYTPEGKKRLEELGGGLAGSDGDHGFDSYASRSLSERCLVYRPVPVRSSGYNNNAQIIQTPGYVAMHQEQIHEVRIIPLDGRPHVGEGIRPWLGDSRGHWEGDTLVVETKNFHPKSNYEGSGGSRIVVERFTRIDADNMSYEYTITDPATWTRPWSAQVPWRKTEGPIFEYACHEGNYGMVNLLKGARTQEANAKKRGR